MSAPGIPLAPPRQAPTEDDLGGTDAQECHARESVAPWLLRVAPWAPAPLAALAWLMGWPRPYILGAPGTGAGGAIPPRLLFGPGLVGAAVGTWPRPGTPAVALGFVAHQVLVAWAMWFNPLTCLYSFVGSMDAPRYFRGRGVVLLLLSSAALTSVGQVGGFAGVVGLPALYACVLAINVAIPLVLWHLEKERRRQAAARDRAVTNLVRAHRDNAVLQSRLVEQARAAGVSEERARLSREIHDTVAQGLVAVIRQLEALGDLDEAARHRVALAEGAARECLVDARRAVAALAPVRLHEADLVEALSDLGRGWSRQNRIPIEFDADAAPDPIPHPDVLLRVAQEALSNVARHADAGSVSMTLSGSAARVELTVRDDGVGFDPGGVRHGWGLDGMAERLAQVGGSIRVASAPGAGTTVTAQVSP